MTLIYAFLLDRIESLLGVIQRKTNPRKLLLYVVNPVSNRAQLRPHRHRPAWPSSTVVANPLEGAKPSMTNRPRTHKRYDAEFFGNRGRAIP